MSNKGKAPMQIQKRGYVSWTKEMDGVLIEVLHIQLKEGNKADGDWKPQAYQAVVKELRSKLSIVVSTEHVKNRIKSWKKHYAVITDIRTLSKFKWDEERKMIIIITAEELEQWSQYLVDHPNATPYRNKPIKHWDDICTLCGPDRALGDGVEMYEEAAEAMDDELQSEGGSSNKALSSSSGSKKQKRDRLAAAVTNFAEYFKDLFKVSLGRFLSPLHKKFVKS